MTNSTRGFSLIEVLLSIALISILAGIGIPVFRGLQTKNDLDVATTTVAQTLRRAQTLSQAVDGDTSWGVKIQTGSITLFKGTSYAARDQTVDELFTISSTIVPSGITEIIFTKFTGAIASSSTTTLSNDTDSRIITTNSKGMVSF
ncbi:hypothetical protein BH09PAT2_BH09PAT2_11530 [soil metagenome]